MTKVYGAIITKGLNITKSYPHLLNSERSPFLKNAHKMAKPTIEIIDVLRKTADRLSKTKAYQWGHMGSCNCGFLAQQVTSLSKSDIHQRAMERPGDWNEQLKHYCATSGLRMDVMISQLLDFGFSIDDLRHLERLSDPVILRTFTPDTRYLTHNRKEHVIRYLHHWAELLEEHLLAEITLEPDSEIFEISTSERQMK